MTPCARDSISQGPRDSLEEGLLAGQELPIFPLDLVVETYGKDVVIRIQGGSYRAHPDLAVDEARPFRPARQ